MATVPDSVTPVNPDPTLAPVEPALLVALTALRDRAVALRPTEAARIERGYQIACAGGVRLDAHGIATVHSQRFTGVWYVLMGRYCPCNDHTKAPGGRCKHRISACLWSRALTQVAQQTTAALDTLPAPYAFPQWTHYEAIYCGIAQPQWTGKAGIATCWQETPARQFHFVPEGCDNGWTVAYHEVILGRGIDA